MTDRYTVDGVQTMMKLLGPKEGKAFFARHPELAPGTEKEYPTVQDDPLDETETAADTSSGDADDLGGAALSVAGLSKDTFNYQKRMQELRQKQFDAAREELVKRQGGPSLSARLAELSAAFFRPKYTRGYAGTMANIMPVLAKQQAATDEGADARATAMRELQDKYDTGTLTGEGNILDYRYKLAKLRDDQIKAAQPKVQINQATGTTQVVPNYAGIAKPMSDEELAAYPDGTPYVAWAGPRVGQILYKGAK